MLDKFIIFIVTGFGAGRSPVMPGTMGSVVGAGLFYCFVDDSAAPHSFTMPLLVLTAACIIGMVLCSLALKRGLFSGSDPQAIVIDEVVGVWIAATGHPLTALNVALAFALFRVFDITKPGVIGLAEKLPGGVGIMADDILAGVFANISLVIVLWILG